MLGGQYEERGRGVLLLGSLKVTEKIRLTENDIVFFRSVSRKITDVIFKFSLCVLSVCKILS